jgi:hypothetical protein
MGARVAGLIDVVRKRRTYYESIRGVSAQLHRFRPRIHSAAQKLKELYDPSIFPPVTFCIGMFSAFGTPDGGAGQLIGAEFLCDINRADTSSLSKWERSVIVDSAGITAIIIHELVHVQQSTTASSTRLARCINEGAADFITQLVAGYHLNEKIHAYGDAHEQELWKQFREGMNSDNVDEWLYNGQSATGKPADLGYYVGYKICEAYYNKTAEKKKAIFDILHIADFEQFLERSGYGQ